MARPEKNSVEYFPHYINHGMKMHYLQSQFGNNGYAVWYKIMERLGSTDYHFLDLSDEAQFLYLVGYCLVDKKTLVEIIDFLCKTGWLHKKLWKQHHVLCSTLFLASIKDAYLRRNNECINVQAIELMYYNNTQSKVDKSKVDKRKEGVVIVFPFDTKEFLTAWTVWKTYKKEQWNFTYKSLSTEQGALTILSKLANDSEIAIEIINQSIGMGWRGFFKLSDNGKNNRSNSAAKTAANILKKRGLV